MLKSLRNNTKTVIWGTVGIFILSFVISSALSIQVIRVMGQGFSFQADITYRLECHKNITNPTLNCHGDIQYFYIFPIKSIY